jgi:murein DD-endopeptidase MepM/ murein hydrolase activator NlpD
MTINSVFFFSNIRELHRFVFGVFLLVLSLPVLAVLTISNIGSPAISQLLVENHSSAQTITVSDPADFSAKTTFSTTITKPVEGVITKRFGTPHLPYQVLHTGLDIANSTGIEGDPIRAFMDGTVIHLGDLSWGYGKHIAISHDHHIKSIYAHLSSVYVSNGQTVSSGDIIGAMGNTGWSTGPHLHFEIKVHDIPVDPQTFI